MVKCCGGLPLAITVLGGILATRHTEGEWDEVFRHVKSYLHEEDNSRLTMVMGLSYDDLPFQLKPCFLYLAHFPEDFEISTKELIRMWMGEGFLPKFQHGGGREDTMEDVGERYLRELVQRCMVLVGEIDLLGRIKTCRIHDLMRDFCVSKAQGENFLQITNIHSMEVSEAHIGKIRRLAINWGGDDFSAKRDRDDCDPMLPLMISKKYPHVRSLLYFSYSVRNNVVKSMFKSFRSLRVLNLENTKPYKEELPKDIGCLIHLRFLSLQDSYVNNVPSSMGNLRCMQTLDLWVRFVNMRVPNVFKKMEQLRHLYLPERYSVYEKLEVDPMATLEKLPNLKILRLLGSAFVGDNMVCSERGFPQLQSLVLSRLEIDAQLLKNEYDSRWIETKNFKTATENFKTLTETENFKTATENFKTLTETQHVPSLVFQHCD
uniref:Uncharacterized protein n=1 Tax=Fagus sylvatica TaxID=28930 RepID=A0A2N9GFD8_FAGSY